MNEQDFSFLDNPLYRENFVDNVADMEIVTPKPIVIGPENMIIPECCREGWDSCPHVPKKQKRAKKNIGL